MPPATDNPRNVSAPRLQLTVASDGIEHIASQRTSTKHDSNLVRILLEMIYKVRIANSGIKITYVTFELRSILVKRVIDLDLDLDKHALNSIPSLATDNLSNFPHTFTADRGYG